MAIQNLAELQAQSRPSHRRGAIDEALARRYVEEIEEAFWNGGGIRFSATGCPRLKVEQMISRVSIEADADSPDDVALYPFPTDLIQARALHLNNVLLVSEASWSRSSLGHYVYRVASDKWEVPFSAPHPALSLEYYKQFPSLLESPNFISLNHPSLYINGFIFLVMTDARLTDKATEYFQVWATAVSHLNETGGQSKYTGSEATQRSTRKRRWPV